MRILRRIFPDGLAGRFAVLLAVALVAANLVALGLLSLERARLDRVALEAREMERIVSLVPAIEAVDPGSRRAIARNASTRFSRVSVADDPVVDAEPTAPRSQALTEALKELLPGRDARGAVLIRAAGDRSDPKARQETVAMSIRLGTAEDSAPTQWLNVVSRGDRPPSRGLREKVFLIVLGLSLVSVLGVGLLFVRRLTRPLGQLAEAARAAGAGDRTARVPEEGAREMREAASAFNEMQARIARFDAERMRTLAAVGHDLRTPITSLRIRAELLDESEAAPIIRTLDEMTVMAEGLVAYAKGSGQAEQTQRLQLEVVLTRVCEDRNAELIVKTPAAVDGRSVALGRAFSNLVDNAIRYGEVAHVTLARSGNRAVVTIEDTGPGIPEERLNEVFEPFVRGDDSRSIDTGGAGLGLSIARNIIVGHGGTIALGNRKEGGLRATVTLPLAPCS